MPSNICFGWYFVCVCISPGKEDFYVVLKRSIKLSCIFRNINKDRWLPFSVSSFGFYEGLHCWCKFWQLHWLASEIFYKITVKHWRNVSSSISVWQPEIREEDQGQPLLSNPGWTQVRLGLWWLSGQLLGLNELLYRDYSRGWRWHCCPISQIQIRDAPHHHPAPPLQTT